jgi:hypothetical protein
MRTIHHTYLWLRARTTQQYNSRCAQCAWLQLQRSLPCSQAAHTTTPSLTPFTSSAMSPRVGVFIFVSVIICCCAGYLHAPELHGASVLLS